MKIDWTRNETLVALVILAFCLLGAASDPGFLSIATLTEPTPVPIWATTVVESTTERVRPSVPKHSPNRRIRSGIAKLPSRPSTLSGSCRSMTIWPVSFWTIQ